MSDVDKENLVLSANLLTPAGKVASKPAISSVNNELGSKRKRGLAVTSLNLSG
jgi:hypothetical protein